jgi:hypothetical protein
MNNPNGGFLPIYICKDGIKRMKSREQEDVDIKTRQFKSHKSSVSIKKIMEQRRNANPFIKT